MDAFYYYNKKSVTAPGTGQLQKSNPCIGLIILFVAICVLATGCGKEDPELTAYKTEMERFNATVQELVSDIESIDTESEDRAVILLDCLDRMNDAFSDMASLDVPKQFPNVEELSDEASANLSRAVSLYHQAFDYPDGYDPSLVSAAQEYYNRAFRRLSYIGTIMQGEIPQDEHITIIDGEGDAPNGEEQPPEE